MATISLRLLGSFEVRIDGSAVAEKAWARRHAAALVKLLALAPGRRLHREQVLDSLWPEDTLEQAAPRLHKAAHYARRAIGVADSIVLQDEHVLLCPEHEVYVDAVRFEELARRALAENDAGAAREAIDLYGGELLPQDRYEPWAEQRREHLRLRHLDLLRLDGRWDDVLDADPADESAHLALMRQHAANGDRHAALRQYERLDRTLRHELGVVPSREATALRDRLLAAPDIVPRREAPLIGRGAELALAEAALDQAAVGSSRTLIVSGPAGVGKSALLAAITARAKERGFRIGQGICAPVEGVWPYAPVVEALADLCRRHPSLLDGLPDDHRVEIDRVLARADLSWEGGSSHQRLFVATAELVRLAAATHGLLLTVDDLHDADDASVRLLHYLARANHDQRVCIAVGHRSAPLSEVLVETRRSLVERHRATELELRPLTAADCVALIRRQLPEPSDEAIERIVALSGRLPFAVNELARRAATQPDWAQELEATVVGGVPAATRAVLQRVAVVGAAFGTDEFVALSGLAEDEAFDHLDRALDAEIVEPAAPGYRFRHGLVRDALLEDLPPHRRRRIHRDAADRLIELGAPAARIGHHLLQAEASSEAVPHLLRAAETDAALGAYRDALALVDSVRPHATGADRARALLLRGDLLNALGDPGATSAYREALEGATGAAVRGLRAKLARSAVMSGDLDTAKAALDGLEPDGGPDDADILLARANVAFFTSDLALAEQAIEQAQRLIRAGQRSWKVLDLVSLQGLLAHRSGNWFDQMRMELRRTRENPDVANAIFDAYLCPAEYLLYGATPYQEVIELARDLQRTARRSGALRAVAFASALIGEAALLSGDLALAEAELHEARDLHHLVGSPAGEAHSLQRIAETRLARGDRTGAMDLLTQAARLARVSFIANHLLQRIFGSMVLAAATPEQARAMVERAEATLGWDEGCQFCSIMLSVPAAIACAAAGDLGVARRHLAIAEESAQLWQGTSWEAGITEARAAVARAEGDSEAADALLRDAVEQFDRAGQPLDAGRCRQLVESWAP